MNKEDPLFKVSFLRKEAVAARTRFLFERVDGWNGYAVFWKAPGAERPAWLRLFEDPFVVSG